MHLKIMLALLLTVGTAEFAYSAALDAKKQELNQKITTAINQCKCSIDVIDGKEQFFSSLPLQVRLHIKKKEAMTREEYQRYISDLKSVMAKEDSAARKIVNEWSDVKGPTKALELKVSESLRAMASYCFQPVEAIKKQIISLGDKKVIVARKEEDNKKKLMEKNPKKKASYQQEYDKLSQKIKELEGALVMDTGKCTRVVAGG